MAEDPKNEFNGSPHTSESNDADFQVNADMMVHDVDDEQTIEEEEMMESTEEFSNEVNHLQKEGDMPIEDLLALYGYDGDGGHNEVPLEEIRPEPLHPFSPQKEVDVAERESGTIIREDDNQSISSEGSNSRESTAQSSNSREENGYDPFQNQRITRGIASLHAHYFENDDTSDDEYQPLADEWRKEVAVGPDFQADIPEGFFRYTENEKVYENEDKMLWNPDVIDHKNLKKYLSTIFKSPEGEVGNLLRDDEQALYILLQSENVDEALKRRGEQSKLPTDVSLWSEEECRSFEFGLRMYGKDFRQIQRNKISHRTVGEIVQFYYLWKKTERFDAFCTQTRFGKKKYGAPGVADYMDRFMDEAESHVSSRSASPYSQQNLVGYSSPSEAQTDQSAYPTQLAHSKSTSHNAVATSAQHSMHTAAQTSHHRPHLATSGHHSTGTHSQALGPSSYIPSTFAHTIVMQSDHASSTAPSFIKANADIPSLASNEFNSTSNHQTAVVTTSDLSRVEATVVGSVEPISRASDSERSWGHDLKRPLIDPVVFSAGQGVYKLHQTNASQKTVTFGGGGYTTASIGQSVE